jgi:methionyl-tRNA formyltransferase
LGWPKSRTKLFDKPVIITKARVVKDNGSGDLVIECQPGWLEVQELTAPSGRTMGGAEFLRGYSKS